MNPHEPMESACPSETEEAISDEEEDLEGIFLCWQKNFIFEMAIMLKFRYCNCEKVTKFEK